MCFFQLSNCCILLIIIYISSSKGPNFSSAHDVTTGFTFSPVLVRAKWPSQYCTSRKSSNLRRSIKTNAAKNVLIDHASGAMGYFNSIRTPASFLAGSSLGSLFLFKEKAKERSISKSERLVLNMYHVLMSVAYALSIQTIIISTVAGVTVLHGNFDPMAETLYTLLQREFFVEFLSTRLFFLLSLPYGPAWCSEKLGARFELPLAVLDTLQVKLSICLDTIKVMSNDGPTSKNNPMQQTAMFLNGTNFTTWLVQNDGLNHN